MRTRALCMAAALTVHSVQTAAAQSEVDCVLEPAARVTISAKAEGTIREIPVGRGDLVEKGDLLVRLDAELESLQLELAQARAESDLDLRGQRERLLLRQKEYDRVEQLSQRNIAATSALDDAGIELSLTELALEQAKFDRKLAAIEVRQAQALLDRRSVQSPLTGRVVAVDAAVGEFANEQTSIMEIVQTDPIHVEVFAPGELFGGITEGEIHEVVLMPPLDGRFNATVAVVDRLFDTASGTFGVRLEIDNPKSIVPSGARCRILFGAG